MERVARKLNDARGAVEDTENEIREYLFAIMKEMQEKAPEGGITIIKTPVEKFTITKEGFRYQEKPNYTPVVTESPIKFFNRLGEMYAHNEDFLSKVGIVLSILRCVQEENKIEITGKYLPK